MSHHHHHCYYSFYVSSLISSFSRLYVVSSLCDASCDVLILSCVYFSFSHPPRFLLQKDSLRPHRHAEKTFCVSFSSCVSYLFLPLRYLHLHLRCLVLMFSCVFVSCDVGAFHLLRNSHCYHPKRVAILNDLFCRYDQTDFRNYYQNGDNIINKIKFIFQK